MSRYKTLLYVNSYTTDTKQFISTDIFSPLTALIYIYPKKLGKGVKGKTGGFPLQ